MDFLYFYITIDPSGEIQFENKKKVAPFLLNHLKDLKGLPDSKVSKKIRICVYKLYGIKEIFAGKGDENIPDENLFGQHFYNNSQELYPTIHISAIDFFSENLRGIPRYIKIIDDSIWNYYVPLSIDRFEKNTVDKNEQESVCSGENNQTQDKNIPSSSLELYPYDFKKQLEKAVEKISKNYERGLYNLMIAFEYANLNYRLLRESYLAGAAHGKAVSPFLFHSEWDMGKRKDNEKNELTELTELKKQKAKWRFLLVDDMANQGLSTIDNNKTENPVSKVDIIEKLLTGEGFNVAIVSFSHDNTLKLHKVEDENIDIYLVWVDTIEAAMAAIDAYRFDIILLDYLLKYSEERKARDYSYHLLNMMQKKFKKGDVQVGPMGKFSIMHISAFTTAITERLQEQGLVRREEIWEISKSACPTNTPQLFLFYLFRLMNRRIDESDIFKLNDILLSIYCEPKNIRNNAINNFQKVLEYANKYKAFRQEFESDHKNKRIYEGKGSVLIRSICEDKSAFAEHLMHLVYLTAYGTIRQWPEMWEEYLFVKNEIPPTLSNLIESHIINLKDNSSS